MLLHISEGNTVLFTPLHLLDTYFYIKKHNMMQYYTTKDGSILTNYNIKYSYMYLLVIKTE